MNIDTAKHIVAFHVGEPSMKEVGIVYPANNWSGSRLLWRMLQLAFLRDGIECLRPAGFSGPLNDSCHIFFVGDRESAIQTIKAELEVVKLLPFCQIGVLDGDDWRCVYPSPEVKLEWLLDSERQELYSSQVHHSLEKLLRKPEGESGGKK
jgi:hypothetical protein